VSVKRGTANSIDEPAHRAPAEPRRSLGSALALAVALALTLGARPAAEGQTFVVLHSFRGQPKDGTAPLGGLLMDSAGNLYGTTLQGGKYSNCHDSGGYGGGIVFKLDTSGVETVLHNFNGSDGAGSSATLIMDANGDLYGTTAVGGVSGCNTGDSVGCGVVFKLSGNKETVLYRFTGGADGAFPWAGLVADESGNFYGTTNGGGEYGGGVVFKLVGTQETVLHAFTGGKDGGAPAAGTLINANGSLYGTTTYGGDIYCDYPNPCGVVFKLTGREETVLHAFKGSPDGDSPVAGLLMDASGNLYGTTYDGGNTNGGTVFEVEASGKERVLHRFQPYTRRRYGFSPSTAVVQDASRNLYGTTEGAGGIAFEITVDGKEKILHT